MDYNDNILDNIFHYNRLLSMELRCGMPTKACSPQTYVEREVDFLLPQLIVAE